MQVVVLWLADESSASFILTRGNTVVTRGPAKEKRSD